MSTTLVPEVTSPGTPVPDEVGQVLEEAADLIEKHGWFNNVYTRDTETLCANMAMAKATYPDMQLFYRSTERFQEHIGTFNVPLWNDAQTDSRDVVRALREAAAS